MLADRQSKTKKRLDRLLGVPVVFFLGLLRPLNRVLIKMLSPLTKTRQKRVLIIKLSAMGDVAVMFPALHMLTQELPAAFYFLGGDSNKAIVSALPFIEKFYSFSLKSVYKLLGLKFLAVIDFEQWVRVTPIMANLTLSPNLIGFKSKGRMRHFAFDHVRELDLNLHTAENFWNLACDLVKKISGKEVTRTFKNDLAASRLAFTKYLTPPEKEEGRLKDAIVIHPGCGEHGLFREWPLHSWLALASELKQKNPHKKIYITGSGPGEALVAGLLEKAGAQSLVGKIDFTELCHLLKQASLIVCCNNGVMHLASLLSEEVVALHGPTKLSLWGPLWGGKSIRSPVACAPCLTWGHDYGCSDPVCMKIITVKRVMSIIHAETTPALF